ncbi:MAG: hypothetical protein ABSB91_00225 [Sedimentisphaerales bacterium]|jgi:hypothetical protein
MSANITLQFVAPFDSQPGDYAELCGNGGAGDIDYEAPLLGGRRFDLCPQGGGVYGWGFAPWGDFPWGDCLAVRCLGWGELPWGFFPWGYGGILIEAIVKVDFCGDYKFAFAAFDSLDNPDVGDPEEITVEVHTAPPTPTGLRKVSYDPDTDILVLEAA